ncbi:hypothetical protein MTR67_013945 [Solanum verrucosum]|uniref:Short-chain dehydrogenase n=1 Tax=Solanum verrucosum TaxID=315347 RepID=A0AAF0TP96_SOLVR|nr:hypothetical protein MTR67_013945 [Solanum verrucosum]
MWVFNRSKGASGFSYSSTAEEVTDEIDGSGLTAIVTGASSGIGAETSRVLALRGVHVIMAVRNITAGKDVKEAIVKEIPAAKVDIMELDLSSLASVRKFAADFISSGHSLNMLINNAGVVGIPFMLSKDNIELQFATNHLGHFLLTNLLLDKMKETTRKTQIVNVSSVAYCLVSKFGRFIFKNVQQGASTTCYVALHPQLKGISGEYFCDNNLATTTATARDMDLAKRLWDFSMDFVK